MKISYATKASVIERVDQKTVSYISEKSKSKILQSYEARAPSSKASYCWV